MMPLDHTKRHRRTAAAAVTENLEARRLLSGAEAWVGGHLVPLSAWYGLGLGEASAAASGPVEDSQAPVSAAQTEADRPTVRELTSPSPRTNVALDTVVAATVRLPAGGGIDETTVTSDTVKLFRGSATGVPVAGQANTSGGGDGLIFQPSDLLEPNATYTFVITDGVKDTHGNAFVPFSTTFTTGSMVAATDPSIAFEKVFLGTAQGERYSTLAFGPDGRLYAGTLTGLIHQFTVAGDGTLSAPTVISSVQTANGGRRFLTGIEFDPAATAANPILWVTHAQYVADNGTLNWNAPDWTGKVSRLSGPGLQTYEDYVVGLPRSVRDHLTNQMDFGPDGALYIGQASNNSMGAPDPIWGLRPERLLSGAILRLDTAAVAARLAASQGALNVQTEETATPYDPWAAGAPLTLYATGLRNLFNPIWHSNGVLYAPTNGSAAGGFTPGFAGGTAPRRIDQDVLGPYTGPAVPALADVQTTEFDYLFRIERGGYYGHPNPTRGEYVLQGGNPTSGPDDDEFTQYPVGTQPDRNRRNDIYTFGRNYAPAGAIEFRGTAFNGALNGALLVARYSGGDDIVMVKLDAAGNVTTVQSGAAGLTHFVDPLDIVQDPTTGFVYVSEDGSRRITLLRPIGAGANIQPGAGTVVLNDVRGGTAGLARTVTLTNTGTAPLALPSDGLRVTGPDAAMFVVTNRPVLPGVVAPGETVRVTLAMQAPSNAPVGSIRTASLDVKSNDPDAPLVSIALRGLVTAGTGGANEPSLQRILDLWQIPTDVGDQDPNTNDLYSNAVPLRTPNDEIAATRLVKAGAGDVTLQVLGVFGVSSSPALRFGWYDAGSPFGRQQLFTVPNTEAQGVNTPVNGILSFDPGAKGFGFYSIWPGFSNRELFSEDILNPPETIPANQHKVRYYRLRDPAGNVVPDALVMAHEEFVGAPDGNYDNQDIVAIVRNVRPAADGPEIGTDNLDAAPYYDRLVFHRIQNNPVGGGMHDTATIRLRNTGTAPLNVTNVSIAAGPYQVVSSPGLPGTIPVGGTADVTVRFVATSGRVTPGTLRISSNDADEAALNIPLSGYWQNQPENNLEPSLQEVLNVLDVRTALQHAGQNLTNGGRIEAIGDEVVSPYWVRASPDRPVTVRQLAAFHTQNEGHSVRWFRKGSPTGLSSVLTHSPADSQTLLPRNSTNTGAASGTFSTTSAFGFKIQNEFSDPALNTVAGIDQGHHVRFFQYRDRTNAVVRDTWLMVMDFSGINFDYNDNVFVVSNVRPENPAAAAGLMAVVRPAGGFTLAWTPNPEGRVTGYNVYRSLNATSGFARVNASPVAGTVYDDVTAARGATYFYRVTAVDNFGGESAPSNVVRTDVTPPAQVQGLTATAQPASILLSWLANTDADLVGYRVLRSDLADGIYTNLSGAVPITVTTFTDNQSPGGFTWHYRVVAVDANGNESEPATISATREGGLGVILVPPTDVTAGGATSHTFAATFSNNAVISPEALAGAMVVTGPGGFSQAATVGAINNRTVSFSIVPPGGTWDISDNGAYAISIAGNAVGDGAGNFIPAQALGTFNVAVVGNPPPAAIDLGTVSPVGKRFKGKFIRRDGINPGTDVLYQFTVTQPAKVRGLLSKMKDDLNFELRDSAGNVLLSSARPMRKAEKLKRAVPAGTYVLRVTHAGAAQTQYVMKLLVGKPSRKDLLLLGGS